MSDTNKAVGDATKVVLAGRRPEWTQGIVSPPVWRASTILYDSVGHLRESATRDTHHRLFYGRKGTPTQWSLADALKAEFDKAGVDLAKPIVMTCGSGITASVLAFGAHLLGNDAALYDGSWSEWGGDPSTPKATGTA